MKTNDILKRVFEEAKIGEVSIFCGYVSANKTSGEGLTCNCDHTASDNQSKKYYFLVIPHEGLLPHCGGRAQMRNPILFPN